MPTGPYFKVLDFEKPPRIPKGWRFIPEDQPSGRLRGRFPVNNRGISYTGLTGKPGDTVATMIIKAGSHNRLPAHVLDYLLSFMKGTTESWGGRRNGRFYFLDTVYRDTGNRKMVRFLHLYQGKWAWGAHTLETPWVEGTDWAVYAVVISDIAEAHLTAFGYI